MFNDMLMGYVIQLRKRLKEPQLKCGFSKDHGYYIETPEKFLAPGEWTHISNFRNRSRYMTPALAALNKVNVE